MSQQENRILISSERITTPATAATSEFDKTTRETNEKPRILKC